MKETIKRIIDMEWDMFDKVHNVSGRAACQDDEVTFRRMRGSHFEAWDSETLKSYLGDLEEAAAENRNLLSEKYAYMMEYTAPEEFAAIKELLPDVPEGKKLLIRKITDRSMKWHSEFAGKYPLLASRGRPGGRDGETPGNVSVETYMLGELATYSPRTLQKYDEYLAGLEAKGRNASIMAIENTVRKYGYASLDDAERKMGAH
ncbi:MAG: DUF4125 family protein [Acidaminococcales bacterium]|jgi:hypothetical protein|nr:DUF4125 family protein [Acidaminococcales bacterium]